MPSTVTRNHARHRENNEGGSQPSIKVVAAAFDQARSRIVARQPPPEALSTSQISRDVLSTSVSSGFSPSPLLDKKAGIKRKFEAGESLFSALNTVEPATIISFDERVTVSKLYCHFVCYSHLTLCYYFE
jgi:hypothetical protein